MKSEIKWQDKIQLLFYIIFVILMRLLVMSRCIFVCKKVPKILIFWGLKCIYNKEVIIMMKWQDDVETRQAIKALRKEIKEKRELHEKELVMSKEEKEERCRKIFDEYYQNTELKDLIAPPMYTALYEYFDLYTAFITIPNSPIRIAMELKYRAEEDHDKYPSIMLETKKRYNALQTSDAKYLYYCTMFRDGYAAIVNITSVNPTWERKWMRCRKDSNTDEMVYKEVFLIPNNECKWFKLNDK